MGNLITKNVTYIPDWVLKALRFGFEIKINGMRKMIIRRILNCKNFAVLYIKLEIKARHSPLIIARAMSAIVAKQDIVGNNSSLRAGNNSPRQAISGQVILGHSWTKLSNNTQNIPTQSYSKLSNNSPRQAGTPLNQRELIPNAPQGLSGGKVLLRCNTSARHRAEVKSEIIPMAGVENKS